MNLSFELKFEPGELTLPFFIMFAVLSVGLVLAGRKLLWLFMGALVFYIAFAVLRDQQPTMDEVTRTLIALGIGTAVGLVALLVRPLTAVLAGFVFGIALTSHFQRFFFPNRAVFIELQVILTVIVVILAIIATLRYRDDAYIIMSVLLGASLLVESILQMSMNTPLAAIVWLSLCLLGVIVQYTLLRREKSARKFVPMTQLAEARDAYRRSQT